LINLQITQSKSDTQDKILVGERVSIINHVNIVTDQ